MGMSREDIPFVSESFYSSSKIVSFISGKSNDSETAVSNLMVNSWSIFSFGYFVLPIDNIRKTSYNNTNQKGR